MIETFVYASIALSCNSAGMSFWDSITWPTVVGRLIAERWLNDR